MMYKQIALFTTALAALAAFCPAPLTAQDSLAAAARKAREQQQKGAQKPATVFTNDNLSGGTVSVVGTTPTAATTPSDSTGAAPSSTSDQTWRDRFSKLNHKLDQDQAELDVLQRELAVANQQYYGGDPMKGMQQGLSQNEINDKTAKIDAKKKDIAADKQAIDDADSDLRKAGGDPGWER